MSGGFPEFKIDGSEFSPTDYACYLKETRVLASQLAAELDLTKYQPAHDEENTWVSPPMFQPFDLTPPWCKHIFAPDVDPSIIIQDDAIIQALTTIEWDLNHLQIEE